MDFYTQGNNSYAFDAEKTNLTTLKPEFKSARMLTSGNDHNLETDLKHLMFLQETYKIKLYSLSPQSPLSKYIPLAPIIHENPSTPLQKPKDCIADILIPPASHFKKVVLDEKKIIDETYYNNIYVKLLKDFTSLPKVIRNHIRYKRKFKP